MAKEPLIGIETCLFKRTETSPWEAGIALNEGSIGILDKYGHAVGEVYDFRRMIGFQVLVYPYLDERYYVPHTEAMFLK